MALAWVITGAIIEERKIIAQKLYTIDDFSEINSNIHLRLNKMSKKNKNSDNSSIHLGDSSMGNNSAVNDYKKQISESSKSSNYDTVTNSILNEDTVDSKEKDLNAIRKGKTTFFHLNNEVNDTQTDRNNQNFKKIEITTESQTNIFSNKEKPGVIKYENYSRSIRTSTDQPEGKIYETYDTIQNSGKSKINASQRISETDIMNAHDNNSSHPQFSTISPSFSVVSNQSDFKKQTKNLTTSNTNADLEGDMSYYIRSKNENSIINEPKQNALVPLNNHKTNKNKTDVIKNTDYYDSSHNSTWTTLDRIFNHNIGIASIYNPIVSNPVQVLEQTDDKILLNSLAGFKIQINTEPIRILDYKYFNKSNVKIYNKPIRYALPLHDILNITETTDFPKILEVFNNQQFNEKNVQIADIYCLRSHSQRESRKEFRSSQKNDNICFNKDDAFYEIIGSWFDRKIYSENNQDVFLLLFNGISPLSKYYMFTFLLDIVISEGIKLRSNRRQTSRLSAAIKYAQYSKKIFQKITNQIEMAPDRKNKFQILVTSEFLSQILKICQDLLGNISNPTRNRIFNNKPFTMKMFFRMDNQSPIYVLRIIDFSKSEKNLGFVQSKNKSRFEYRSITPENALREGIVSSDLFMRLSSILLRTQLYKNPDWMSIIHEPVTHFKSNSKFEKIIWLSDLQYNEDILEDKYTFTISKDGVLGFFTYQNMD